MSASDPLEFLGEEFLTWLWFRLETQGGDFDLPGNRKIGVSFDDFLAFAPRDDDETEHTLKKGTPSRSPEASTALRSGHRLRRAKIIIGQGEMLWSFVLDGPTMGIMGARLPDDDQDSESLDERSHDRIRSFLELQQIVAAIYRVFLQERLAPDYSAQGATAQATWMATR
jgi:hypothetical protein